MNDTFVLGLIGAGLILTIISTVNTISQLKSDITRMNIMLNKIAAQVGVPGESRQQNGITNELTIELKSLLLEGKRIKAIKAYRMATGIGLLEAKDYVDNLDTKLK
jgi:ribosomal protein L7/L12